MARMTFVVELIVDSRLPEEKRADEAKGRLVSVSGVTRVEAVDLGPIFDSHGDLDSQIKDATEGRR